MRIYIVRYPILYFLVLSLFVNANANSKVKELCRLESSSPVISLSAPVTHYLYFLGLLNKKNIAVISSFHSIGSGEFDGEIIQGGLFLSPQFLKKYPHPHIFFDENREQRKTLERLKIQKLVGVATLSLDPFQVYHEVKSLLLPLLKGCEGKIKEVDQKVGALQKKIDHIPVVTSSLLFFLGEIYPGPRYPHLIMVADGPPKYWQQQKKWVGYKSDLSYLPWSSQILKEMKKERPLVSIGLKGEKKEGQKFYEVSYVTLDSSSSIKDRELLINVLGSAPLLPGLAQIYFMASLADEIRRWPTFFRGHL